MSIKAKFIAFWEWLDWSGERQTAEYQLQRESFQRAMDNVDQIIIRLKAEKAEKQRHLIAVACCDEMERRGLITPHAKPAQGLDAETGGKPCA